MNTPRPLPPDAPTQQGLTLVEALVVVAIGALVAAGAAPSLERLRQTRALLGAAAQVETDLQFARTEAIARNRALRVAFGANGSGSCLVVHTGGADDCRCAADGSASCAPGVQLLRQQRWTLAGDRVQLQAGVSGLWIDPVRGTVTPTATLRLVSADGRALHDVVNLMGRVRTCTPDGGVSGVRPC